MNFADRHGADNSHTPLSVPSSFQAIGSPVNLRLVPLAVSLLFFRPLRPVTTRSMKEKHMNMEAKPLTGLHGFLNSEDLLPGSLEF